MKVSYQWLSQYVDLSGFSAEELAEKLTRSGVEVDVVESLNKGIQQVFVGYVKTREKHPDADKLSVCTVDVGGENDLQIVCGAKNVAAGQKVPVAVIGAKLPGDFKIKRAKLRGVESQGMICSAKELGMNDKLLPKEIQEGILVLPENTEVGQNILDVLGLNDQVLELDLTPNRGDCLSMIGVAYEIGAIIGREVKLPDPLEGIVHSDTQAKDRISVKISAEEQCHHYAARYIENVVIGPSPLWMQNCLMAAGVRPINNIVDVTNYVMLEYGQPLHAFDADRLNNGQIDVRLAHEGEKLVTLDDAERILDASMLLITDGEKPVALAGVMGGANSEVTANTRHILLESAKFAGSSVRKTSRQLGLRSEASLRFEKEVNPETVIPALDRAASLLSQYAGGQVAQGVVETAARMVKPVELQLQLEYVNRFLGTELSLTEITDIFARLNFPVVEQAGSSLLVQVPSRRGDITHQVDLLEEIARLHGYDSIPTTLISGVTTPGTLTKKQKIRRFIRRLLTDSGLHEVVNYSLTHPQEVAGYPGLFQEAKPIALSMPMSEERSVLKTSLVPNLMDVAVYNRNRAQDDVAVFELGTAFVADEAAITKLPQEKALLALLITGKRGPQHWTGKPGAIDFYDLKGIVEKLLGSLGLSNVKFQASRLSGLHPGRAAEILIGQGENRVLLGWIGQLHPQVQQDKDLEDTYVAEIALDVLYEHVDFATVYQPLPRYPSVGRDLAVVVDKGVETADLADKVREVAGSLLESVEVFDVFTGERLGADKKSVALALVYRHPDHTLTDDEVGALHEQVVNHLQQTFAAQLRK